MEEETEIDFINAFAFDQYDENGDGESMVQSLQPSREKSASTTYKSKKPLWWRRISRKPSKGQRQAMQAMKNYILTKPPYGKLLDWRNVFDTSNPNVRVAMEIGFGSGHNLLALAQQYPDMKLIGTEVHTPGVAKVCQIMQEAQKRKQFWEGHIVYRPEIDPSSPNYDPEASLQRRTVGEWSGLVVQAPYDNLRLSCNDGVKLLSHIPSSSVEWILVTFPDPFPRDDQSHWRLIQTQTVQEFRRVLRDGGYFYLATDHEIYNDWANKQVLASNAHFTRIDPCPDRHLWLPVVSIYERKGWVEGRRTFLNCWEATKS